MTEAFSARINLGLLTMPGAECFYCDHRAIHTAHDARGCVPVCDWCGRWRAGQPTWSGHMDGCSDTSGQEPEQPSMSTRRRELK